MATTETRINGIAPDGGRAYQFGRFTFLIAADRSMTLLSDGHAVGLTGGELTILRVLLESRGQFVKTKVLLDSVTQSPRASENIVHGAVRELRRTLHDAELIKTERTRGYCFTGEVKVRAEADVAIIAANQMAHDLVTSASSNQSSVPERRRDTFLIVALLVSAAVLLLPFGLALGGGSWGNVGRQLSFIQALMILVAIGYDFFLSNTPNVKAADNESRRATIAVQQLRRSWRLLLTSWCLLYVTLLFSQGLAATGSGGSWQGQTLQVIATFLNNAGAVTLVLCYLVLNRPTVIQIGEREVDRLPLGGGLVLVALFGLLEAALVISFEKTGHPDYAAAVLFAADLLSGVAGGIAMALFISRLDSRLLGASRWLPIIPVILYFYVVIQPFYPLLNWTFPLGHQVPEHFDLWVMQLAFMLKSVMYIYVTELFKSRRFLFYMIFARRAYEDVDNEWTAFKTSGH
ncbi:MAG TPA: helix-turn-helix domain-containing protein [Pyrinomonadaceae bacterium]|nr:helix-turn-helix domain-containing protein [Pyrinomonadaceae bacterium]